MRTRNSWNTFCVCCVSSCVSNHKTVFSQSFLGQNFVKISRTGEMTRVWLENKFEFWIFYFTSFTKKLVYLTCGIHDRQHDGRDPCYLAVRGVEDELDVLEEDRDGLGKRVGEPDGDERSQDHSPPPTAIRRWNGGWTWGWQRHLWSTSERIVHWIWQNKRNSYIPLRNNYMWLGLFGLVWLSDHCKAALLYCSRLTLRYVDTIKVQMNQPYSGRPFPGKCQRSLLSAAAAHIESKQTAGGLYTKEVKRFAHEEPTGEIWINKGGHT